MGKTGFIKYYVVGLTVVSLTALFLSLNSSGDVKKLRQEISQKDQLTDGTERKRQKNPADNSGKAGTC